MATCLHVLATADAIINLLAVDWALRQTQDPLHVVIWTTPGMLDQGRSFEKCVKDERVTPKVEPLPQTPAPGSRSGPPLAWKAHFEVRWHEEYARLGSHHIWAYGGATKPLSIAMWLLYHELAQAQPKKHVSIYPDQTARVWLTSDEEQPLDIRFDLRRLLSVRGARLSNEPVLTPDTRKAPANRKVTQDDLSTAKHRLGGADMFEEFLLDLALRSGIGNGDLAFEALVVERGLQLLAGRADVAYAYHNADPSDRSGAQIGEKDLLWIGRNARVFALDAKNKHAGKFQTNYKAQIERLRTVAGRYSFLAYVVPKFKDQPLPQPRLPVIPFDRGTQFESELSRWIDGCTEQAM